MSTNIFLCHKPCNLKNTLNANCEDILSSNRHIKSEILLPGTPYIINSDSTNDNSTKYLNQFLAMPIENRKMLATLNSQVGSDVLLALSELFEKEILPASKMLNTWANNEKYNLAGAGATLLGAHNQGLMGKIIQYEKSLNILNEGVKNNLSKSQIIKLENHSRQLYSEMNNKYGQDLSHLYNKVKAKKGTPLNNINRGLNIAKSSRHSAPINISNSSELKNIKNLSNGLKFGGNALIAYDAYNRSNQVYNDYKSGKDWKKTAIVQSSGLTVGVISGSFTASAVSSAAVSIGLAATPVGWVIAIGIGLTATYYVSTSLDKSTQKAAASLYDLAW